MRIAALDSGSGQAIKEKAKPSEKRSDGPKESSSSVASPPVRELSPTESLKRDIEQSLSTNPSDFVKIFPQQFHIRILDAIEKATQFDHIFAVLRLINPCFSEESDRLYYRQCLDNLSSVISNLDRRDKAELLKAVDALHQKVNTACELPSPAQAEVTITPPAAKTPEPPVEATREVAAVEAPPAPAEEAQSVPTPPPIAKPVPAPVTEATSPPDSIAPTGEKDSIPTAKAAEPPKVVCAPITVQLLERKLQGQLAESALRSAIENYKHGCGVSNPEVAASNFEKTIREASYESIAKVLGAYDLTQVFDAQSERDIAITKLDDFIARTITAGKLSPLLPILSVLKPAFTSWDKVKFDNYIFDALKKLDNIPGLKSEVKTELTAKFSELLIQSTVELKQEAKTPEPLFPTDDEVPKPVAKPKEDTIPEAKVEPDKTAEPEATVPVPAPIAKPVPAPVTEAAPPAAPVAAVSAAVPSSQVQAESAPTQSSPCSVSRKHATRPTRPFQPFSLDTIQPRGDECECSN